MTPTAAGLAAAVPWAKRGGKAAGRGVTKEVRSGEIGFSGRRRKNNFTAQQGSPPSRTRKCRKTANNCKLVYGAYTNMQKNGQKL